MRPLKYISLCHLLWCCSRAFQVCFALLSSPVFSRMDMVTDSERFYNSILDLFEDVDEQREVNDLQMWWNRYVISLSNVFNLPSQWYVVKYSRTSLPHKALSIRIVLWLESGRSDLNLRLSPTIYLEVTCNYECHKSVV